MAFTVITFLVYGEGYVRDSRFRFWRRLNADRIIQKAWKESGGCKVIRYTNYDIDQNFESVCIDINKHIAERLISANGASSTIADEKESYV